MRISEVKHGLELAAARGHFPEQLVAKATVATVLEAAANRFHATYFGKGWSEEQRTVRSLAHNAREDAMKMMDHLITDIEPVYKRLGAAMTTTDFPLVLAQVRDRVRRESYNPVESSFFDVATRRTARDFKLLRGIRTDPFDRLKLRPEGASVEYAAFASTEDGYSVANYELAIPFTWEAWVNDDIGEFLAAMENLGIAARRNRALVVIEAVRNGTVRTTLSGANVEGTPGAGGPTPANLVALYQVFAEQTNADGKPMPRLLSTIAVPAKWTITARQTLNSQLVVTGATSTTRPHENAAQGLAALRVEPMLAEVFGEGGGSNNVADWLGWDASQRWLEFATLSGYEGGPRTYTKLPDVVETLDEGSFDNHAMAIKVSDNIGAKVTDTKSVVRVAGA